MATRLIIQEQAGKMRVDLQRADGLTAEPYGEFTDFAFPMEPAELEDLRWYLEDYLPAPYAVWEEKGERIQALLPAWGTRLFETVFGQGRPFRDAYIEARGKEDFQIWISSKSAGFLGLPWELLFDPELKNFIALNPGGIHRTLPARVESEAVRHADRLRVLMVIARPQGEQDVPYQMIARQLLQRIELVSGKVVLDVLRPPTFQALKQRIARAAEDGTPYDVLHFDGHGSFGSAPASGQALSAHQYQSPEGYLVFENENGLGDPISAESFSTEMQKAKIPLFVFNACKSGQLLAAGGPEAAVVTRLIQQGAAAAVAMGYSVYAVAAAEFMAMFYEALFAGRSVAEAVQEGRRQMRLKNQRPSPKGGMPLHDWLVPVHYARKEIYFPQLKPTAQPDPRSLADTLNRLKETRGADAGSGQPMDLLQAQGRFFGRDAELYRLERAFGRNGVVIAHGVGGSGKTELAKAFARWLQASGGLSDPRLVFMDVFEPGLVSFGLPQVLSSFGLNIMGPDFVREFPSLDQQRRVVLEVLAGHRILWIWDNFETVCSLPDQDSACRLDPAALEQIKDFLLQARKAADLGILITSRSPEKWLGPDLYRIEVGGLNPRDGALYADDLLATRPKAQKRRHARAFGDLMAFLGGHPLSMRLILPHLERVDAQALLNGLKGQGALPPGFEGGQGRLESLGASVHYSFHHLPEQDRQRLPALSLFEGVADVYVLALLSDRDNVPDLLRGVPKTDWEATLSRCSDAGLLTSLWGGMYRMHPALPGYLAALWKKAAGGWFEAQYEQVLGATIRAHALLGGWLDNQINTGRAETAMAVISIEKPSFLRMLQEALDRKLYSQAHDILQPINEFWNARGLFVEARGWVERLQDLLENEAGAAPDIDSAAGALWLLAVKSQIERFRAAGDLAAAEKINDGIRKTLEQSESETSKKYLAACYHELGWAAQDRGDLDAAEIWHKKSLEIGEALGYRPGMASSYHHLGMVAQDRGDLDAAEIWYKKSLEIEESLGNRPGMASSYHELGILAQRRGDLDTAEIWYKKSLEIKESLGNRPDMASSYHQLGMVAQHRGDPDAAEIWYKKSLEIKEALGNRPGMASTYHQLGRVAEERGDLDAAEIWYKKSLEIEESLGNRPDMALTYHQLGMVAQHRGDLDTAEIWYKKSLEIKESLGNRPGMALTYHQLGMVAQDRGDLDTAEIWYKKSLEIKEALGNRPGMASSYGQLGLLAEQRGHGTEALDWTVRCICLFDEFPHPATGPGPAHLKRLAGELGTEVLEARWRVITGSALPDPVRRFVEE